MTSCRARPVIQRSKVQASALGVKMAEKNNCDTVLFKFKFKFRSMKLNINEISVSDLVSEQSDIPAFN
jgi:hypothetical protein